jgi:hypothetical protein
LSTSACLTPAASALRLNRAAHFVAIGGPRKSQRHGAASLHLHAKGHIASINTATQLGGTSRVLKRAAQRRTILLDLTCGLL